MTTNQKFEKLLRINRRLFALELPVICTCGYDKLVSNPLYIVLKHTEKESAVYNVGIDKSIEYIIMRAKRLAGPSYTQVTEVCFSILDSEFYLDKQTLVTVESITKEGILLSNGQIVEHTRLYIKE